MDARGRPCSDRLLPVSDDYTTLPVSSAFTWDACASEALEGVWYLVAFRSVQRLEADQERLFRLDDAAHAEAAGSPGFVHYFKGPANARRECLSFCLWDSRRQAREAAGKRDHVAAISLIAETYERYTLEFLRCAPVLPRNVDKSLASPASQVHAVRSTQEERTMGDEKNRATAERMRELYSKGDISAVAQAMDEYASEDIVEEWPQSGERIRGLVNVKKLTEGYGEATGKSPKMTFGRLIGGGDVYVAEGTIDYGDGIPVNYVGIAELRDGKVVKLTEYFANPFEAPAWRADIVERMDKVPV